MLDEIRNSAKAIAAGVVAAFVAWAARHGVDIPDYITIPGALVVAGVIVWFTRNVPKLPKMEVPKEGGESAVNLLVVVLVCVILVLLIVFLAHRV
jgi:hypothetical protein